MISFCFAEINNQSNIPNKQEQNTRFATQSSYALGAINTNYQNYIPYNFPLNDIQNFMTFYNSLGGLPSLGYSNQENCFLNVVFNGYSQLTCNCPQATTSGQVVSFIAEGQTYCENQLVNIAPVTFVTGSLTVYQSKLDPSCDPSCYLHGECFNGKCICQEGWNGTNCQILIVPKGYLSSVYTILWKPTYDQESLAFNLLSDEGDNPNCTMYLYQMPSQYTYGPTVPVGSFTFDELSFGFYLEDQEAQVTIMFYIMYPKHASFCVAQSFIGRTTTTGYISYPGTNPQIMSSYFLFDVPERD